MIEGELEAALRESDPYETVGALLRVILFEFAPQTGSERSCRRVCSRIVVRRTAESLDPYGVLFQLFGAVLKARVAQLQ